MTSDSQLPIQLQYLHALTNKCNIRTICTYGFQNSQKIPLYSTTNYHAVIEISWKYIIASESYVFYFLYTIMELFMVSVAIKLKPLTLDRKIHKKIGKMK